MGLDIDGEAAGDASGGSLSINGDGKTVAIGSPFNDDNGDNSGQVRIYDWNGSIWLQQGADINGNADGDNSGEAVSISNDGNTIAIGASNNSNNGTNSGHVRVYDWNGVNWLQRGSDINGENQDDLSGTNIHITEDGMTVAIGASHNSDNGTYSGHVRIYDWDGTNWLQRGLDIDGESAYDSSGKLSMNSSGSTIAIGAQMNDGSTGSNSGHVRVFDWNGTAWLQRGLDIDGENAGDRSGSSLSIDASGNTLAIGAVWNDGNGNNSGHVRVFNWNGTAWLQKGLDIDGENAGDNSGNNVSISSDGNTIAVAASKNSQNGSNSGHVRVFDWNGTNWLQRGLDIDSEMPGDQLGSSLSISNDGNTVAIGAKDNDGNGTNSGHVRLYSVNTNDIEIERIEFKSEPILYPNPTNSKIVIQFDKTIQNLHVRVYSPSGNELISKIIGSSGKLLDLSNYNSGVYFVQIRSGKNIITKKIIKQ